MCKGWSGYRILRDVVRCFCEFDFLTSEFNILIYHYKHIRIMMDDAIPAIRKEAELWEMMI
jgi:hypothetical protein